MAHVDGPTLLMAVQAVQVQIHFLAARIEQADADEDVTDLEHLLLGYAHAADALRLAYEAEELINSNLPPYELLMTGGPQG